MRPLEDEAREITIPYALALFWVALGVAFFFFLPILFVVLP